MSRIVCLSVMSIIVVAFIQGCPSPNSIEVNMIIGTHGIGVGEFDRPLGLVNERIVAPLGSCILVADYNNNRIQVLPELRPSMNYVFGIAGSDSGQFIGPVSLAVTMADPYNSSVPPPPNPRIYVTDSKNHRIQKFDIWGNFLQSWGAFGTAEGEFNTPTGIDLDFFGHIYVIDSGNSRVQVFDTVGNFIRLWGSNGSSVGQFNSPIDIAAIYDKSTYATKYLAISDYGNNRIQLYDTSGIFFRSINNVQGPLGLSFDLGALNCVSARERKLYRIDMGSFRAIKWGIGETQCPYDVSMLFITDQERDVIFHYNLQ